MLVTHRPGIVIAGWTPLVAFGFVIVTGCGRGGMVVVPFGRATMVLMLIVEHGIAGDHRRSMVDIQRVLQPIAHGECGL